MCLIRDDCKSTYEKRRTRGATLPDPGCTSKAQSRSISHVASTPFNSLHDSRHGMTALAASSSAKEWRRALDSYSAKIVMHATSAKRRAGLEALDRYVREDLPRTVGLKAQDEGGAYLTKEDLCKVVEWKITVRPHLSSIRCEWRKKGSFTDPSPPSTWSSTHLLAREIPVNIVSFERPVATCSRESNTMHSNQTLREIELLALTGFQNNPPLATSQQASDATRKCFESKRSEVPHQ